MGFAGGILGVAIFTIKVMIFMVGYIWFRGTFPRFRFDQLMDLGWKWMIPLALANIVVTGILVLAGGPRYPALGELLMTLFGIAVIGMTLFTLTRRTKPRPAARVTHASRVSEV